MAPTTKQHCYFCPSTEPATVYTKEQIRVHIIDHHGFAANSFILQKVADKEFKSICVMIPYTQHCPVGGCQNSDMVFEFTLVGLGGHLRKCHCDCKRSFPETFAHQLREGKLFWWRLQLKRINTCSAFDSPDTIAKVTAEGYWRTPPTSLHPLEEQHKTDEGSFADDLMSPLQSEFNTGLLATSRPVTVDQGLEQDQPMEKTMNVWKAHVEQEHVPKPLRRKRLRAPTIQNMKFYVDIKVPDSRRYAVEQELEEYGGIIVQKAQDADHILFMSLVANNGIFENRRIPFELMENYLESIAGLAEGVDEPETHERGRSSQDSGTVLEGWETGTSSERDTGEVNRHEVSRVKRGNHWMKKDWEAQRTEMEWAVEEGQSDVEEDTKRIESSPNRRFRKHLVEKMGDAVWHGGEDDVGDLDAVKGPRSASASKRPTITASQYLRVASSFVGYLNPIIKQESPQDPVKLFLQTGTEAQTLEDSPSQLLRSKPAKGNPKLGLNGWRRPHKVLVPGSPQSISITSSLSRHLSSEVVSQDTRSNLASQVPETEFSCQSDGIYFQDSQDSMSL